MVITKTFETLKQAERYLNWLYDRHDHVELVSAPRFQEAGEYVFRCSSSAVSCQFPDLRTALIRKVR
jgi:hypothetical protein